MFRSTEFGILRHLCFDSMSLMRRGDGMATPVTAGWFVPQRWRITLNLSSVCLLLLGVSTTSAQEQFPLRPQRDGSKVVVDVRTPAFEEVESTGRLRWQQEVEKIGTRYVRLHFDAVTMPPDKHFAVQILDRSGVIVEEIPAEVFRERQRFWSAQVLGGYALIRLLAERPPVGLDLRITELAYQAQAGAALSVIGERDFDPIVLYDGNPMIANSARPVAKLLFVEAGEPYVCTGFLVAEDQLVTNHHCVSTKQTCGSTVAVFGNFVNKNGIEVQGEQYRCVDVLWENYKLDVSVLRIGGAPGSKWGVLKLKAATLGDNQGLFIVQHPAGEPKQVVTRDCSVSTAVADGRRSNSDFGHTCDTLGGSSGSPVFDSQGFVVGLHHFGVGEGNFWNQNRAVRISEIVGETQLPVK